MLAEIYVETLLAEPVSADRVWALWSCGLIADDVATRAWLRIAFSVVTLRAGREI